MLHAARSCFSHLITAICAFALPAAASACLWDRDTLAKEAEGLPEVVEVITGRFERNSPLFYEMRLRRLQTELAARPREASLYDDAAVACDRLGRSDEAILWMMRKQQLLENDPATSSSEQQYRLLANLGTFYAHRWISNGARHDTSSDLVCAVDAIREALLINPQAHFGRERYQLEILQWLLDEAGSEDGVSLSGYLGLSYDRRGSPRHDPHELAKGLSGLIVLGNAWQSIDVFDALATALQNKGHGSLCWIAYLRCAELADGGKRSLLRNMPDGKDLKRALRPRLMGLEDSDREHLGSEYTRLRESADKFHQYRTEFMNTRLAKGLHPDTHPDFWSGYSPPLLPAFSTRLPQHARMESEAWRWVLGITGGTLFAAVALFLLQLRLKARS